MAKPFKSEFDLMAEAYGTINRSKQAVINEHTSARSVIGYPPQVIEESSCSSEHEEGEHVTKSKFTLQGVGGQHGQTTAGDNKSFNSLEEVCAAAGIDPRECQNAELWDTLQDGTKEFQVDEDNVIVMHSKPKMDYSPSGEGKEVHPDEDAENPAHVRLDGMVHQELFSQLQKALTAVVADLHADGEEFEVSDVIDYLGSKMA